MKKNEKPIPVRSIVGLPRWLMTASVVVCVALLLSCLAGAAYGLFWVEGPARWGWIGGCLGGGVGAAGGLFGTLADWRRRMPATMLLAHVQNDTPSRFYRRVFWPALAATIAGLVLVCFWNERVLWHGLVQTGGILAFVSGTVEVIRRHTTRQARALFALYADGALAPEDALAIDDARAKNPKFDAEVRAFQELGEQVRRLAAGSG